MRFDDEVMAGRTFQAEVIQPALDAAPGLAQLVALCDAFFDHLRRRAFPGGCFFAGAALAMGSRPGPAKEQVVAFQNRLGAPIRGFIVTAIEQRELPADEDPDELTFEVSGMILAANANFVLRGDPAALGMAKTIVRRRLGVTTTETSSLGANGTPPIRSKTPTQQAIREIAPLTRRVRGDEEFCLNAGQA